MIYFMGTSFAAKHLKHAAIARGNNVTENINDASLIFVSEDTPTNENGFRQLDVIRDMVKSCPEGVSVVLTSQVPVGFTRSLGIPAIVHQAETLRVKDAMERAISPEQIIVGYSYERTICESYASYLFSFECPVHFMTWEEAEFSKIAINMTLVNQVENTNALYQYAKKHDLNWSRIQNVLQHDKRIGPHSYLEPGRWQDSPHLFRDYVTFHES